MTDPNHSPMRAITLRLSAEARKYLGALAELDGNGMTDQIRAATVEYTERRLADPDLTSKVGSVQEAIWAERDSPAGVLASLLEH